VRVEQCAAMRERRDWWHSSYNHVTNRIVVSYYTTMNQKIVAARTDTTLKPAFAHFLKFIVWLLVWGVGGIGGEGRCAKWKEIASNNLPVSSVLLLMIVGQLLSASPVNFFVCSID